MLTDSGLTEMKPMDLLYVYVASTFAFFQYGLVPEPLFFISFHWNVMGSYLAGL